MKWLRDALINEDKEEIYGPIKRNYSSLTCAALTYEQRFSVYGEIMS
jgi:hypothetical protein